MLFLRYEYSIPTSKLKKWDLRLLAVGIVLVTIDVIKLPYLVLGKSDCVTGWVPNTVTLSSASHFLE